MARTSSGALLTDKHRREQVRLAITADSQARRVWDSTLDLNDLKGTQPIWKNAILDLLQTWWRIGARTANAYLPRFREAETGDGGFETAMPRFDRERAARDIDWTGATNVLWHIARGETQEAAWAAARSLFLGVFHEAVLTGGRATIENWARKDTRAIGWRRVSDGNPCAFCAMLVTRGPVYTSKDRAGLSSKTGGKYHAHCGCTVEVVYGDWHPTEKEQQWIDEYYKAAESLPSETPRTAETVLPILRRNGGFRDSAATRSTPEFLARRRKAAHEKKIAKLVAPETTGGKPTLWAGNVQPPTDEVIRHILHGDPERRLGGHLSGTGTIGKTEFPENWDENRVIESIRQVMENPDWVHSGKTGRDMCLFGAVIDGVQVEVGAYRVDGWKYVIDRAYPRGGKGVFRNTKDGRIEIPTSKGRNWRKKR